VLGPDIRSVNSSNVWITAKNWPIFYGICLSMLYATQTIKFPHIFEIGLKSTKAFICFLQWDNFSIFQKEVYDGSRSFYCLFRILASCFLYLCRKLWDNGLNWCSSLWKVSCPITTKPAFDDKISEEVPHIKFKQISQGGSVLIHADKYSYVTVVHSMKNLQKTKKFPY
jgi:hypothetical protein